MAHFKGLLSFVLFFMLYTVQTSFVFDPKTLVEVTLRFREEPQDVVVRRGGSAMLNCVAESQEQVAVSWQHGTLVIVPDPRRYILQNGSLMFEKVLHKRSGRPNMGPGPGGGNGGSDEGEYTCLITNTAGTIVSRTAFLRTASLAREFTESPEDQVAQVGDTVRFGCQVESWPPASFTWEKDGKPLTLDPERFDSLEDGVIHLNGVKETDAGNYRCVANNSLAERSRRSPIGRLQVRQVEGAAPRLVTPPVERRVYVPFGGSVVLECATAGINDTVTTWTKAGEVFPKPALVDVTTVSSPSTSIEVFSTYVRLSNISRSDSSEYACSVASRDGIVSLGKVWQVVMMEPPRIVQLPKSAVYPTAKTARLECEVVGVPQPDLRWIKDGKPVSIGGRIKQRTKNSGSTSELVLSNSITTDTGLYQCVAESRAGYSSVTARLLVNASQGRPDPPSGLKAATVSPTEVLLAWDLPKNVPAEEIKAFTVHYMPTEGGEELQDVSVNTSHKVEKLKPYTNYTFYVRAYSRKSASDQSDRVTATTGEDVPVAAPEVTLNPLNPTTLYVSWQRLPANLLRGSATHYKIQYRKHKQRYSDIYVVKPDVQEYTLRGLHPGKKYDVRVLPGNTKNWQVDGSRDWPWYTAEMPRTAGESGLPTPNLYLICTNHSAIQAFWSAPVPGPRIPQGFRLSYKKVATEDTFIDVDVPLNQTSVLIDNLDADTLYEVQLLLFAGDSVESTPAWKAIRTLERSGSFEIEVVDQGIPPPEQLEVEGISPRDIKAFWAPVELNVTYYTLRWHNAEDPERRGYLRCASESVNGTGFKPFTKYIFSVAVSTADGKTGAWSDGVEYMTKPDVPSAPYNLTWTLADKVAQLAWTFPDHPNGPLLGFTMYVSTDDALPLEQWKKEEIPPVKVRAKLTDLKPDVEYTIRMSARTPAGSGPLSEPLKINMAALGSPPEVLMPGEEKTSATKFAISGELTGILLGLLGAVLMILLCTLVWRFSCIKRARQERNAQTTASSGIHAGKPKPVGNGHVFVTTTMNGNIVKHAHERSRDSARHGESSLEMEVFTPMLASLPLDTGTHIDTKGGYSSLQRSSQSGSLQRPTSSRATDRASSDEGISVMADASDGIWRQRIIPDVELKRFVSNRMEEWADVTAMTSLDVSTLVEEPCPSCTEKLSSSVSSFVSPTRSTYSSTLGATSPLLSSANTPCTPTGGIWSARIIATPVKPSQTESPVLSESEPAANPVE